MAYEVKALGAIRNLILGQEAYMLDNRAYAECLSRSACVSILPGFRENDTSLGMTAQPTGAALKSIYLFTCHAKGRWSTIKGSNAVRTYVSIQNGGIDQYTGTSGGIFKTNTEPTYCLSIAS